MTARCIGCGAPLAGACCAACGAPARGARFREPVHLRAGMPLPPVCCCCLELADTVLELERVGVLGTRRSALPACRACVRARASSRSVFLAIWLLTMVGAVVLLATVLPPRVVPPELGLALVPLSFLWTIPMMRVLWSSPPGHVHGCAAARLGGRRTDRDVHLVLHNRAYASLLQDASTPASQAPVVDHGARAWGARSR